jgi:hypothetical protein
LLSTEASGRCRFSQETFAGSHGNGREAPIPAIRGTEIERQGSTLKHTCRNRVRWSFNRAIDKRNAAFPTRRRVRPHINSLGAGIRARLKAFGDA